MIKKDVETILELIRRCRGNKSAVARIVGIRRQTVKIYCDDTEGLKHAIVNGVLMVAQGNRGKWKSATEN